MDFACLLPMKWLIKSPLTDALIYNCKKFALSTSSPEEMRFLSGLFFQISFSALLSFPRPGGMVTSSPGLGTVPPACSLSSLSAACLEKGFQGRKVILRCLWVHPLNRSGGSQALLVHLSDVPFQHPTLPQWDEMRQVLTLWQLKPCGFGVFVHVEPVHGLSVVSETQPLLPCGVPGLLESQMWWEGVIGLDLGFTRCLTVFSSFPMCSGVFHLALPLALLGHKNTSHGATSLCPDAIKEPAGHKEPLWIGGHLLTVSPPLSPQILAALEKDEQARRQRLRKKPRA
ncbi:hypothetical protein EK904_005450 [Melospiza melodia maxima]|nr:hypothetical protein EK904_005450 [Melospiza melodia maxima]